MKSSMINTDTTVKSIGKQNTIKVWKEKDKILKTAKENDSSCTKNPCVWDNKGIVIQSNGSQKVQ
jgi:hypothetical protein